MGHVLIYLFLLGVPLFLGAQTDPVPLRVTRFANLGHNVPIDNRSPAVRLNNMHTFCATGTGTWSVALEYSDSSSTGPWVAFGGAGTVANTATDCIGVAFGYHPWLRFNISGTATATYSATKDFYIPPSLGGAVTLAGDVTGPSGTTVVERIRGRTVNAGAPSTDQFLGWDGAQWLGRTVTGAMVTNTPAGGIAAVTVQTAINELDTEKALLSHTHAAADIVSGQLGVARGGSGLDGSATGGANQFVKQSTLGGAFTVGTIGDADVPDTITASNYCALAGCTMTGALAVVAEAYDATGWNADTGAPQKDAIRDYLESLAPGGIVSPAAGGTGDNTNAVTGVPRITSGNWTYDAGIVHLAASSSADLRATLNDENGTGPALFGSAANPTFLDATIDDLLTFAESAGDATCGAGDYWVKGNSTSGKMRGCENGSLFDVNTAAGATAWSSLTAPTAGTVFTSDATGETVIFSFESAFTTGNQFLIRQQTGNPTGGALVDIRAADADVIVLRVGDGTNGIQVSQAGALTVIGTGTNVSTSGDSATAFWSTGQCEPARGCTGDDTSGTTGVPRIASGNWTYDAGISHLASSTSANLRTVLSDENGTGPALFDSAANPTLLDVTVNDVIFFTETAGDATCAAGDFWVKANSTTNTIRKCQNGTVTDIDTGGSGTEVTAASTFGTDNRALRSDGTARGAQGSLVDIDDSGNISTPGTVTSGSGVTAGGSIELGNNTGDTAASFLKINSGDGASNTEPAYLYLRSSHTTKRDAFLYPCTDANGFLCVAAATPTADGTAPIVVAATSSTATHALFATATPGAVAYRAIADADVPDTITLTNITQITNRAASDLTYTDNVRITFNPGATVAGINVGSQAGDPSTPTNGDLWYDSTGNLLRARINGVSVSLGAGSGTVTSVDATGGVQTASGSPITATGTIRGAWVANAQIGTSYTVLTGDRGKVLTFSNAGAIAVALPQAGTGFEDGWFTIVKNIGAGDVTITPTTSTISGAASIVLSTGEDAAIRSDGTNYEAISNRMVAGSGILLAKTRTAVTPSADTAVIMSLAGNQVAGGDKTFTGVVTLPQGTAPTVDAVGEIAMDTNHWGSGRGAFLGFDGTAGVALVGILTSDTCANGEVAKFNTGGTWTCEADATGGTSAWDTLTAPTGATSLVSDGTSETVTFSFESAFSAGNQFLIRQQTGNPTAGTLFAVTAADADIVLSLFQRAIDGSAVLMTLENSQANVGASTNEAADMRFLFGGVEAGLLRWGKTEDYTSGANESSFFAIRTRTDGTTAEAARFLLNGVLDVVTGFRIGGAAASNAVLAGNGTNFVATTPSGGGAPLGAGRALTGGAGIAALGDLSADRTIATASGETDFLASGALTCGASTQGRMQVHTTPLQYCDNAATPALQYAAYANSIGSANELSGMTANGIAARTGAATWINRTITGTTNQITVTNGDGVSGNPTIDVGANVLLAASTHTLTNKTIDVEGTGNTITTVSKVWLAAASCQGTTGALLWDTIATQQPTATCSAGTTETNLIRGVADFLDTGTAQMQIPIQLPADFTGAIDVTGKWRTTVTTNSVVWQVSTVCRADAEVDDAAFNTANTVTDTAKGTANQLNDFSITGITTTGCAAGELMHLRILRDPAHASDTLAATASLVGLEVTLRRAQ